MNNAINEVLSDVNNIIESPITKQIENFKENKVKKFATGLFYGLAILAVTHITFSLAEKYFSYPYTSFIKPIIRPEYANITKIQLAGGLYGKIVISIVEEFVFRGVIQKLLLRYAIGNLVNRISPRKISKDHDSLRMARIVLTTGLFSLAHRAIFLNKHIENNAFLSGIVLGVAMETSGLITSSTAHALINATDMYNTYKKIN